MTRVPGYAVVMHRVRAGADSGLHRVDTPLLAIALSGNCSTTIDGKQVEASSHSAWIEPGGLRRRNRIGRSGALLLSILPDDNGDALLASPRVINDPLIAHDAARMLIAMLKGSESLVGVDLHCHVLSVVSRIARRERRHTSDRPVWIELAREFVHANYRSTFELRTIADAVGVTVPHLARGFRAHYGVTVGEYVRRLRILWASELLAQESESLASVSLSAGFFDQSHFSREFRRQLGITPSRFRRATAAKR